MIARTLRASQREPPKEMILSMHVPPLSDIRFHGLTRACNLDGSPGIGRFSLRDIPYRFELDHVKSNFVSVSLSVPGPPLAPRGLAGLRSPPPTVGLHLGAGRGVRRPFRAMSRHETMLESETTSTTFRTAVLPRPRGNGIVRLTCCCRLDSGRPARRFCPLSRVT